MLLRKCSFVLPGWEFGGEKNVRIHENPLGTEEKGRIGKDTFIRNGLGTEGGKARYFMKKM